MSANSHRPPALGGFVAPEGTVTKVISHGFYTCGTACPNPRACLADEHCERGVSLRDAAAAAAAAVPRKEPAQNSTAATSNQLTATYEALRAAIKPLGDKLREEQHAKRDAAWQAYYVEHDLQNRGHNSMVVAGMHDTFNAGWEARKKAELAMVFGLDTPRKA